MQEPSTELISRAQQRDRDAEGELFRQCYPYIRALGRQFCAKRNGQDAEDLAQEIASAVWNSLPNYCARRGAFFPWVYGIAKNMAYDSTVGGEPSCVPLTGNEPAEDIIIPADLSPEFRKALAGLPEIYRSVLWLRCVHGLGEEEIAECLGIDADGVHSRLYRGRKMLRDLLNGAGINIP